MRRQDQTGQKKIPLKLDCIAFVKLVIFYANIVSKGSSIKHIGNEEGGGHNILSKFADIRIGVKKTCQHVGGCVKNQEKTADVLYGRFLNVMINT